MYNKLIQFLTVEVLHSLYPGLLKRMDDSSDEIRIATTKTLVAFIGLVILTMIESDKYNIYCLSLCSAFPDHYCHDLYKAHSEALFKGLLVHLDDPSKDIQVGFSVVP